MRIQKHTFYSGFFHLVVGLTFLMSVFCFGFPQIATAAITQWTNDDITAMSAGNNHTCAIDSGSIYCWGNSLNGELGIGETNGEEPASYSPLAVYSAGLLNGKVATHVSSGNAATCAIADGQAYCWGREQTQGKFGNGAATGVFSEPTAVDTSGVLNGKTLTDISLNDHACVVATDGQAYCWGSNYAGQLGDNSTTTRDVPVAVDVSGVLSGKTVTAVSVSGAHTCVIADGQAYCWGSNAYGQLGNNSTTNSSVPVAVDTTGALNGKAVSTISAGINRTCAIADDEAYCWGINTDGMLGDGSATNRHVPTAVDASGALNGRTVTDISISSQGTHTCAVADGQAYCWGVGANGRLGNGSLLDRSTPYAVDSSGVLNGKTVNRISAGALHSCAIADGQAYCWGGNSAYQLGRMDLLPPTDPTNHFQESPVAVSTIEPEITDLNYVTEDGDRYLKVTGAWHLDPLGFVTGKPAVVLNGVKMPLCTNSTYTSSLLADFGVPADAYSDEPICYEYTELDSESMPVFNMWYTYISIRLPAGFDEVGGVSTLKVFNAELGDNSSEPDYPFVNPQVNGKSLTGTQKINPRPTFSGSATPNSQITVDIDSGLVTCETTSNSEGVWACSLTNDLSPGMHQISIHITTDTNQTLTIGPYSAEVLGTNTDGELSDTGQRALVPVSMAVIVIGLALYLHKSRTLHFVDTVYSRRKK